MSGGVFGGLARKLSWKAVLFGWAVAIATGLTLNLVFEAAHVLLFGGEALDAAGLTTALATLALISGFAAHFAGGYVAGRRAGTSGGLHGVMVAVLGFLFVAFAVAVVSAIIVATVGVALVEAGITFPQATLGFAGGALLTSLALLGLNLLGGFLGGKMGEWEKGPAGDLGRRSTPSALARRENAPRDDDKGTAGT